jgi:hypothetical protein
MGLKRTKIPQQEGLGLGAFIESPCLVIDGEPGSETRLGSSGI